MVDHAEVILKQVLLPSEESQARVTHSYQLHCRVSAATIDREETTEVIGPVSGRVNDKVLDLFVVTRQRDSCWADAVAIKSGSHFQLVVFADADAAVREDVLYDLGEDEGDEDGVGKLLRRREHLLADHEEPGYAGVGVEGPRVLGKQYGLDLLQHGHVYRSIHLVLRVRITILVGWQCREGSLSLVGLSQVLDAP